MPNPISPIKLPTARDRCKNFPDCGRRCTLRSTQVAPAVADPSKMKSPGYPSQVVMGLNIDCLRHLEKEAQKRKRSSMDTRLTKSNNATPFVPDVTVKIPEPVFRTPQSTGALERCSNCGSPAGPRLPTKFPKSSRTQRSLTFEDDEVLRDASKLASIGIVELELSPILEKFLTTKCSSTSPFSAGRPSFTPPVHTPERLNTSEHFGRGADASPIEFEISRVPASWTPPKVPTPVEKVPDHSPVVIPRKRRQTAPISKSSEEVRVGRYSLGERPATRYSTGSTVSNRSLHDRLKSIVEKSPVKVQERQGTDVVSMLIQKGEYHIVLEKILGYVTEDDLCSMCCVSPIWQRGVFSSSEAINRRKEFLKTKRIWLHSPDIENSRMLRNYLRSPTTFRPRTTAELRGYLDKATQSSGPAASQVSTRRFSLTPANSSMRSPRRGSQTVPRSESDSRFWSFVEAGKKLNPGEHQTPCPQCRQPARVVPGKVMAECMNSTCRLSFCPQCLVGSPRRCCRAGKNESPSPPSANDPGLSPLRPWASAPSIGSRKSKRNLRRLMDK